MLMHKALHPKDDIKRLYASRKEGGRELTSVIDHMEVSIWELKCYKERQILAAGNSISNIRKNRTIRTRKQKCKKKNNSMVISTTKLDLTEWELWKRIKFEHMAKCCRHKQETSQKKRDL